MDIDDDTAQWFASAITISRDKARSILQTGDRARCAEAVQAFGQHRTKAERQRAPDVAAT